MQQILVTELVVLGKGVKQYKGGNKLYERICL